jgi:peroxiredoxin Q/BCP
MYGRKVLGIIRSTFLIDPRGVIRQIWSPVKVKDHAAAVLAALESARK